MLLNKTFRIAGVLFVLLNLLFYLYISIFHEAIPFNTANYVYNAHHFIEDSRQKGKSFSLLESLGQFDAQWYLRIAAKGYPKKPRITNIQNKTVMDGLTYAFFPLYPLIIRFINVFFQNILLSAFITTQVLLILTFLSLSVVIAKLFSKQIAIKTIFLLFLFPFSVFFRSYFTEGLLLFELVWFSYFLIKRQMVYSGGILGLLLITRGTGLFLLPVFLYFLIRDSAQKKLSCGKSIFSFMLSLMPLSLWMWFCFHQTGNLFYFLTVRKAWWTMTDLPIIHNMSLIVYFFQLPLHAFHASQIDLSVAYIVLFLLIVSKGKLKLELWLIAFAFWLGPLLTTDTMSYTRYETISFPLFLYLAQVLPQKVYGTVLILFAAGLLIVSLLFINWYWIG